MVQVGEKVPDFTLPASGDRSYSFSEFLGKIVVLYFYPKDMTPGCTTEACDFRDRNEVLQSMGAVVIGISPDPVKSHEKFIGKHALPFPLLSDEDHQVAEMFGVWKLKKRYGREYMGIERSTFLIDRKGILRREWRNVKVAGHAEEVTEAVQALGESQ